MKLPTYDPLDALHTAGDRPPRHRQPTVSVPVLAGFVLLAGVGCWLGWDLSPDARTLGCLVGLLAGTMVAMLLLLTVQQTGRAEGTRRTPASRHGSADFRRR